MITSTSAATRRACTSSNSVNPQSSSHVALRSSWMRRRACAVVYGVSCSRGVEGEYDHQGRGGSRRPLGLGPLHYPSSARHISDTILHSINTHPRRSRSAPLLPLSGHHGEHTTKDGRSPPCPRTTLRDRWLSPALRDRTAGRRPQTYCEQETTAEDVQGVDARQVQEGVGAGAEAIACSSPKL